MSSNTMVLDDLGTKVAQANAYSDVMESKLRQVRGRLQESWGALTNSETDRFYGRRDQLVGMLQEKYGYTRAQAVEYLGSFIEDALADDESSSESEADAGSRRFDPATWVSMLLVTIAGVLLWNKSR